MIHLTFVVLCLIGNSFAHNRYSFSGCIRNELNFVYSVNASTVADSQLALMKEISKYNYEITVLKEQYQDVQNQIASHKHFIPWLSDETQTLSLREQLKSIYNRLNSMEKTVDALNVQLKSNHGVMSEMFWNDIKIHASKMLSLARDVIETLIFWETVELIVLSFFFGDNRENQFGLDSNNKILLVLLGNKVHPKNIT